MNSNYAGLAFKVNLEKHPENFIITEATVAEVEQKQKKYRAEMAKLNEKVTLPQAELNTLRKQLFDLQHNAKAYETRVNNEAGSVNMLEDRINTAIKNKKVAEAEGNMRGERSYEHEIQAFETELLDARKRLLKDQRYNAGAVRDLRTWLSEHSARLEELKQEIAAAKSDKEPK